MSYRQKKEVEASIKRREHTVKGKVYVCYEAYFGTDPFPPRKPVRITRDTEEELKNAIKDFYLRHQAGGDAAARLTAMQALDAKTALDELAAAGENISLTEAVRAFLGGAVRVSGNDSDITIGAAWQKYYDGKKEGDDKTKHKYSTGKFVNAYGADKRLSLVTAKEVVDYLEANYGKKKPKTYNSHLLSIKTFFNWCAKDAQKYIAASPIKSVEFKPEPWEEPEYMKVEDVARLFKVLEAEKERHPEYLAQAVVSFFCGSRAVEIRRMAMIEDAAKIHLDDETIRIAKGKGFQRGRRPRAFHVEPTAMAWIKSFDFLSALKMVRKGTIDEIYKLARKNKIPVFQNCGRHTFITYHVSAYGDPAKTQAIVGTSEKYRAENYCGLASKANGEAYFKIWPSCFSVDEQKSA